MRRRPKPRKLIKQYVRVPVFIDQELRNIQGSLIRELRMDIPYTTIVNLILMAGLLGTDKLSEEDWRHLRAFLVDQEGPPPLTGRGDQVLAQLTATEETGRGD